MKPSYWAESSGRSHHSLTFSAGQGWGDFLPQFGWGAAGGWIAAVIYMFGLGVTIYLRWRSGAWRHIQVR